ncbi:uncharacterized protein V1516DRAFT_676160 [Lipomyces oligophaga]|uniref:uncharacterized protein n=1 Tax=Lipomyces oligophaga TaxID=45792 RepID=UPI0034CD90A2
MIVRAYLSLVLLLIAPLSLYAIEVEPDLSPSAYLAQADLLLGQGQYKDALQFYDAAVKADPQNYLSLFKRGATYLSIGRLQSALSDFDHALDLKPDFESALLQRGKLRLKLGQWAAAKDDFARSARSQTQNLLQVNEAEEAALAAQQAFDLNRFDECIARATTAISYASALVALRVLRASCRIQNGHIREGIADLGHVVNANPLDADTYVRIAKLEFFSLNERDRAIQQLSKCLNYDPDSQTCKQLFRDLNKLNKDIKKAFEFKEKRIWGTFEKALLVKGPHRDGLLKVVESSVSEIIMREHIPTNSETSVSELLLDLKEALCESSLELQNWGSHYCPEILKHRDQSIVGLLFNARIQLQADEFDRAIEILHRANEIAGGHDQRVRNLLHEAQVLQKRANSKDYYKVLSITRDATDKEIKKAYRNKTKEFHPDKYRGDLAPDQVERKMAEINEAYEVLSDPELRQRFDNGDDPNDPLQGAGSGPQFRQRRSGSAGGAGGQFFQQQFFGGSGQGGNRQFFQQSHQFFGGQRQGSGRNFRSGTRG